MMDRERWRRVAAQERALAEIVPGEGLATRARTILRAAGLLTREQIAACPDGDLLCLRNAGPETVALIRRYVPYAGEHEGVSDMDGGQRVSEREKRAARRRVWAEEIAKFELSGGKEGNSPAWVDAIQAGRFLGGVGPWELVDGGTPGAAGGSGGVSREVWQDRVLALMEAIQIINIERQRAVEDARQRQAAAAGLLVPQGTLRA